MIFFKTDHICITYLSHVLISLKVKVSVQIVYILYKNVLKKIFCLKYNSVE